MKPKAILFDLDGTLIDTISLYEIAMRESLGEFGIPMTTAQFTDWYHRPLHLGQILQLHGRTEDEVPALRNRRDAVYIDLLRTKSAWLPGAREWLESLTTLGTPTAVITGSWMTYVDAIDENLDVKKYFKTFVTADDIHKFMKPHPHGLLLAADRLGVEPTDCVYIGDQIFDSDAATRAGMPSAIIRAKWTPKNLGHANAVATVNDARTWAEGL